MNWKSMTPAISITGQVVALTGPKLKPLVSPASLPALASWSTVIPLANFGRFAANWVGSKNNRPKTAISAQPAIPRTVK